jgi:hypothetical protein
MERTSEAHIIYTPREGATPEGELEALAAVYRSLLLEKGDRHVLTNKVTTGAEGAYQGKKGNDRDVYC